MLLPLTLVCFLQGGYDLVRYNVTRLCEAYITPECIQQQGADTCMYEHIQGLQRQQAQQQRQQLRTILLAVLVPAAGEDLAQGGAVTCMRELSRVGWISVRPCVRAAGLHRHAGGYMQVVAAVGEGHTDAHITATRRVAG